MKESLGLMDSEELALQQTSAIRQQSQNILQLAGGSTNKSSDTEEDTSSLQTSETSTRGSSKTKNSDLSNTGETTKQGKKKKTKKTAKTASVTSEDSSAFPPKLTASMSDATDTSAAMPPPPLLAAMSSADSQTTPDGDFRNCPGATAVPGFNTSVATETVAVGNNTDSNIPVAGQESQGGALVAKAVTREDLEDEVRRQLLSEVTIAEEVHVLPEAASPVQGGTRFSDATRNSSARISIFRDISKDLDSNDDRNMDDSSHSRRKTLYWVGCCIIVIAVITGVLAGLLGSRDKGDRDKDDSRDKDDTQNHPVFQVGDTDLLFLLENASNQNFGNQDALDNETSPQRQAYEWLKENGIETLDDRDRPTTDYVLQLYAMVTFYYATNGGNWRRHDLWLNPNSSICDWYPGDLCADGTRQLRRRTQQQKPSLPLILQSLPQIVKFAFSNNDLVGTLPDELEFLQQLNMWNLNGNPNLVGTFPTTINKLRKINTFRMSGVGLTGTFPSTLLGMQDLRTFVMSDVSGMSGPFPYDLWNLNRMKELNLEGIGLTGTLPTSPKAPNRAYLARNNLSGSIPLSAANDWAGLSVLDVSFNKLTGTIPAQLQTNFGIDMFSLRLEGNPLINGIVPPAVCEVFESRPLGMVVEFVTDCLNTTGIVCSCCTLCCLNGLECK